MRRDLPFLLLRGNTVGAREIGETMVDRISDRAMHTVEYALNGLAKRAETRANNLANVNTPNYRAMRVDFESALQDALDRGVDPMDRPADPAVLPDPNFPNGAKNTVSVEGEMIGMMKDNLTRDSMVNSFQTKTDMLRAAMGAR